MTAIDELPARLNGQRRGSMEPGSDAAAILMGDQLWGGVIGSLAGHDKVVGPFRHSPLWGRAVLRRRGHPPVSEVGRVWAHLLDESVSPLPIVRSSHRPTQELDAFFVAPGYFGADVASVRALESARAEFRKVPNALFLRELCREHVRCEAAMTAGLPKLFAVGRLPPTHVCHTHRECVCLGPSMDEHPQSDPLLGRQLQRSHTRAVWMTGSLATSRVQAFFWVGAVRELKRETVLLRLLPATLQACL